MIEVYSKENCQQCDKLVALFDQNDVQYKQLKLDTDYTKEELLDIFAKLGQPAPRSFPIVFADGEYIGGYVQAKFKFVTNKEA